MTATDVLPATNAEGFDLIARHLSPHKARAYQDAGILLVQGRREGVRVWDLDTTEAPMSQFVTGTTLPDSAICTLALNFPES